MKGGGGVLVALVDFSLWNILREIPHVFSTV